MYVRDTGHRVRSATTESRVLSALKLAMMEVDNACRNTNRVMVEYWRVGHLFDLALVWQTGLGHEKHVTLLLKISLLRENLSKTFQIFLKMT